MVKRKLVTQEEGMGCGLACVASELGISYQRARKTSGGPEGSYTNGYYCEDLVRILNESGRSYIFRKVRREDDSIIQTPGTIVFAKRGRKYPEGHWLLMTSRGWMNPWINWPSINPAKAGYEKRFPGIPEWIVYED